MDETDLFDDFDQSASSLLDEAIQRLEYLRDQLIFWRATKRKLERGVPVKDPPCESDPVDELLKVAGDAWKR